MAKVRLNIEVSQDLADLLDVLAEAENATRSEIVRRAISVLRAYKQQREIGRSHLGFTADPRRLDAEILGILNASVPTDATMSSAASLAPAASARAAPASGSDAVLPPTSFAPTGAPATSTTLTSGSNPVFSTSSGQASAFQSIRSAAASESCPVSLDDVMSRWSPHAIVS